MPWSNYEENNGYSSEAETRAILNGFKPRIQKLQGVILCTSVREIPVRECVVCGKVMSLYDVFLGSEFGEFEGLHQDCTEQYSPKTIVV